MSDKKAAYMVVVADVIDGEKMGQYQAKLMESGLYPANGGTYTFKGRPIEIFEGEWADNRAVLVARFPSADDARNFWYSDTYQNDVKPLREGAASVMVGLFEDD